MELIEKHGTWNKGKLVGQKPPLKPKNTGKIGCDRTVTRFT